MNTAIEIASPRVTLLHHEVKPCFLCQWWHDDGILDDHCWRLNMPARVARADRFECGIYGMGWQPRITWRKSS